MRPSSRSIRNLAAPLVPGVALFGHADGFNWDEALMVLAPIAILAAVLLYANHRVQGAFGDEPQVEGDEARDAEEPAKADSDEVARTAGPTEPT